MVRKSLLFCGILSVPWYITINVLVPQQYPGYNLASYTVSELSAIGSPTRQMWVELCIPYNLLFAAFGTGILLAFTNNRNLRFVAIVVIIDAVLGVFWPPMHQREVIAAGGSTLTDTLHLVWTFIHLVLMLLMIGFAAVSMNRAFRNFSLVIVFIFVIFGILTASQSRGIEANLPTPNIGTLERVNILAYMLWIIVFSIMLLNAQKRNPAIT